MTWRPVRTGAAIQWVEIYCDQCGKRTKTVSADEYSRICAQDGWREIADFCDKGCAEAYDVVRACRKEFGDA